MATYERNFFDPTLIGESNPSNIRNVCILAHVDHGQFNGKTTLSDHLISSNGLISQRAAGHIRYLDSREDEQKRLITMKASCITLSFKPFETPDAAETESMDSNTSYWINLVDSPGHVDFSSEVSAAVRLCDGALILIDAVEGVCPQTRQVIVRAFAERTKLLLVINKMDRLITNLCLSPSEAYAHLCTIIEQVNAITQQLLVEEAMQAFEKSPTSAEDENEGNKTPLSAKKTHQFSINDYLEDSIRFSPEKGNVVFCSSLHSWAFDIPTFAKKVGEKLGIPVKMIPKFTRCLWGNFYLHPKTKMISNKPPTNSTKPMIIQLVLEQLWKVYECTYHNYDIDMITKILQNLKIPSATIFDSKELKLGGETTRSVMSAWLPFSKYLLNVVVKQLPSPIDASHARMTEICPGYKQFFTVGHEEKHLTVRDKERLHLFKSLKNCGIKQEDDIVIYSAKFLGADLYNSRLTGDKLSGREKLSDFVAISRIFSGIVQVGQKLFVCGTEFAQQRGIANEMSHADKKEMKISRIFYLLGQDLVGTNLARAGSVVALCLQEAEVVNQPQVNETEDGPTSWMMSLLRAQQTRFGGVKQLNPNLPITSIDRCITLSSSPVCPPFRTPYAEISSAIVRVCLEPKNVKDTKALLKGLAILYKADPGIEVNVLETGEVALGCLGEIHLEKCLHDLQNLYAQIELNGKLLNASVLSSPNRTLSPPLVAVRESLVVAPSQAVESSAGVATTSALQSVCASIPFPPWHAVAADQKNSEKQADETKETSEESSLSVSERNVADLYFQNSSADGSRTLPLIESTTGFPLFHQQLQMNKCRRRVVGYTPNNTYGISIRAEPLPGQVIEWLDEYASDLQQLLNEGQIPKRFLKKVNEVATDGQLFQACLENVKNDIKAVWAAGDFQLSSDVAKKRGRQFHAPVESFSSTTEALPGEIVGISVSRGSRTLLFWDTSNVICQEFGTQEGQRVLASLYSPSGMTFCEDEGNNTIGLPLYVRRYLPALLTGFELASQNGPLCEEPVLGVAFSIEVFSPVMPAPKTQQQIFIKRRGNYRTPESFSEADADLTGPVLLSPASSRVAYSEATSSESTNMQLGAPYGPLSGQIISCMKDCCRRSLLQRGRTRIYEAMHRLELQCEQEVLGRAYGVLSKRRAQIVSEVLREGTSLFSVEALMPVIESFGLALDLRSKASGQVALHVQFSHWQMLDEDPFPEASMTEEELEDEGESGFLTFPSNIARRIIYTIRRRKGLPTDEKVIVTATKQRTLARCK